MTTYGLDDKDIPEQYRNDYWKADDYEKKRICDAVSSGIKVCCAINWCEEEAMCYCDPEDHGVET